MGASGSRGPDDEDGPLDSHAPTTPVMPQHPEPDDGDASRLMAEAVPAPPAQVEGGPSTRRLRKIAKDERLRADAVSTRHLMTHFPYNPLCLDCAAKLKSQPARRTRRADPETNTVPEHFGIWSRWIT